MDTCLIYAPIITFLVTLLKRIPFIGRNPKIVATFFSLVVVAVPVLAHGRSADTIVALAQCVVTTLGLSVGAYEIAKPALKALHLNPKKNAPEL